MAFSYVIDEVFIWFKWRRKPYIEQVSIKEGFFDKKQDKVLRWLKNNAKSGWKCVGYVAPTEGQIEYFISLQDGKTYALPHAFIGFRFKNVTEAVLFKMVVYDL